MNRIFDILDNTIRLVFILTIFQFRRHNVSYLCVVSTHELRRRKVMFFYRIYTDGQNNSPDELIVSDELFVSL